MKFKFGDFEAEIDAVDLDFETRFEECYQKMVSDIGKIAPDGMRSGRILKYCTSVFCFFNDLFGDGADKKIFGEKTNMRVCDSALETLSICISKSIEEYEKESKEGMDRVSSAFGVKQNRAQRRAKK